MLSNDDQGIELTDFDDMMDWVGDWAPEFGLLGTILEPLSKSYITYSILYSLIIQATSSQYLRYTNNSKIITKDDIDDFLTIIEDTAEEVGAIRGKNTLI